MTNTRLISGHVLSFGHSPFEHQPDTSANIHECVAVQDGYIVEVGSKNKLHSLFPHAQVSHYNNHLILPGFIDPHVHYPQTAMIASWGKRLIDWLTSYTFPEELKFHDYEYASLIAKRYLDLTLAVGTTTVCTYCTTHTESVNAFFQEAQKRHQRVVAGKTCMDRNAPEQLCDTATTAYDDSKRLLNQWHGIDRLSYAITPRFAPTSTPEQLDALGSLWKEYPTCLMQTHLCEQLDEIAWVRQLFPDSCDYVDVYEQFGLLGENGLYGHAIHLTERERGRLHETNAAVIHCPTSNTFIGSGLFDLSAMIQKGQCVGLASDVGGGSSFSQLRTMASAYEIAQLRGNPLHAAQLLWLATVGSAKALRMDDKIGNLLPCYEADMIALDLASIPAIAQRSKHADSIWEAIFPTIMLGDDRAITQVWIAGEPCL